MEQLAPSPVSDKKKAPGRPVTKSPTALDMSVTVDPKKTYVFELLSKSPVSTRIIHLSGECRIFDKNESRIRIIRYIPQASSIFKDEQDDSYTDADVKSLYFDKNQLTINGTDLRGVEYCLHHDLYDGVKEENRQGKKGAMFTLLDKDAHERRIGVQLDRETTALTMIKEAAIGDLKPMARIIFNILDRSETIIRNRLREKAKLAPKNNFDKSWAQIIIENIDNPQLIRRYNIQVAVDNGILEMDNHTGMCVWADSKNPIVAVNPTYKPSGQVAQVAEFTFRAEGKEFYEVLKERMN